jgi:TetR/AcrR family transcriptional regulator, transcriptional repressor of bet genes
MAPKVGVAPLRREEIIQATIRCLARDGSSGLRMKNIAREARVSQAILHYYFTNKREILTATLETVTADLNRRIANVTEGARDARSRLRGVVRGCLGLAEENRDFWLVFVAFWGEMMHDGELARFNAAVYRKYRRMLGSVVLEGVRAKLFRRIDPEEAGAFILAIVDGISLQRTFDPKAFTLERATRLCEDGIERYLDRSINPAPATRRNAFLRERQRLHNSERGSSGEGG